MKAEPLTPANMPTENRGHTPFIPVSREAFLLWLKAKGYVQGRGSSGHLGRQDAWAKELPGTWPNTTIRYFPMQTKVRKESSLGFGSFGLCWEAEYDQITINPNGKISRAAAKGDAP